MAKSSCVWLSMFLVLCLVLSAFAVDALIKDVVLGLENPIGGQYDIYVADDRMTKSHDMLTDALKRVDRSNSSARERAHVDFKRRLRFVYKWKDPKKVRKEEDIFTAKNVQSMCKVEHVFLAQGGQGVDGTGLSYKSDFCVLNYEKARMRDGAPVECEPQPDTPAGAIYAALNGTYSGLCALLPEEDVRQAALCLLYLPYVEDESALAVAAKSCACFYYRIHPDHRHEQCDSACSSTPNCKFDVSKGCGSDPRKRESTHCNLPHTLAHQSKRKAQFTAGRYMSKDVKRDPARPSTGITGAYLYTGKPLYRDHKKLDEDYGDRDTRRQIERTNREFFSSVENELKELFAVSDPYRESNTIGDLIVLYQQLDLVKKEQLKVFAYDMFNLVGSAIFLAIYLRVHIGSWFLALMGVVQIFLSMSVSMFVFAYALQIRYFKAMQFLVLFIAMGIGADDLFVICNAWEQSGTEVPRLAAEDVGSEFVSYEHARTFYAVERAFDTMFSTTLTTALAFFATASSKLLVMQTFGIFAGVQTVMLFVFSMLLMPVVILIWHRNWEFSNCCCCCKEKRYCRSWFCFAAADRLPARQAQATEGPADRKQRRCVMLPTTLFCRESTTMMFNGVFKIISSRTTRPKSATKRTKGTPRAGARRRRDQVSRDRGFPVVALVIVVLTLSMTAFSSWQFGSLEPPPEDEQYLPMQHMDSKIQSYAKNVFFGGHNAEYIEIQLVWGLQKLKRDDYDKWYPNENRGVAVWSEQFSALTTFGDPAKSSSALHSALINACRVINEKKCDQCDKCGDDHNLALLEDVYNPDEPHHCWPHFFELWVRDGCDCAPESASAANTSVTASTGHRARLDWKPACSCPSAFPHSNQTEYAALLKRFRASNPSLWRSIGFVDGKLRFAAISFTSTAKISRSGAADRRQLWNCLQDTVVRDPAHGMQ